MPVSSAMLVSGETSAFPRQQVGTTSSVRLRKRKDDLGAPGRRKERHSGDFSYSTAKLRPDLASELSDSEGDWNYITFPQQGEANVQEVRVTSPSSRGGDVAPRGGGDPNPLRLRTNLQCSRAVSSSAVNLQQEPHGRNQRYSEVPQMRAQERSHLRRTQEEPRLRANNPRQEDVKLQVRSRQQQDELKPAHGQEGVKLRAKPRGEDSTSSNCPQRRQSHLVDLSPVPREEKKGNSKRCSGEFEFRKGGRMGPEWSHVPQIVCEDLGKAGEQSFTHDMVMRELSGAGCDTGSEGSEESGVFSTGSNQESPSKPRPGLGRRAVTQVDLKERKNSYNSALARSQENLVTASPEVLGDADPTLKKGLLWQQRDKLFSRWKERYFILTKDLVQCFKKGTSRITEMGEFIFSIKLAEVEAIELLDKRGYLTICISLQREGKVYLRRTEGIRDWYNAIKESMEESKVRRNNRASAIFADRRQNTDCSGMEGFVAGRKLGRLGAFSDSTPEVNRGDKERITLDELSRLYRREEEEEERKQEADAKMNRLSMMSCDGELELEKGVFLRRREQQDSGNNSLQSSTGTSSSKLSQTRECNSFLEEEEADYLEQKPSPEVRIKRPAANTNIIEVRYRERNSTEGSQRQQSGVDQERRRSRHVNRLQITNV